MNKIVEDRGDHFYEYYPLGEHIVIAPGICSGRPTFKYTRVEMFFVLKHIANGESIDNIIKWFDGKITHEGIQEAMNLVVNNYQESLSKMELAS